VFDSLSIDSIYNIYFNLSQQQPDFFY